MSGRGEDCLVTIQCRIRAHSKMNCMLLGNQQPAKVSLKSFLQSVAENPETDWPRHLHDAQLFQV